ncbi:MAG: class I SAM-dependent RNA methyltransferase [Sphingomonadaceae bacterium]
MSDDDVIVRIAARGDGVTADGRYAAYAAPGDWLRGDGSVERGPDHADPACRHFPKCGGCQLQHLSDRAFTAYLTDRIVGALDGQGLAAPAMLAPHLSPPQSRRRLALRAERRGKQVLLGFNEGASHKIVELRECPVMRPELFALLGPLRTLLPLMLRDKRTADIRMTMTDQGVDIMIAGVEAEGLAAAEAITAFAAAHKLARLSLDEGYGPAARWEPDPVTVTLGGIAVPLPEGAFLQATSEGEAALISAVRAIVGDAAEVADLFAGLGTFSFAVSGRVHAVEAARDVVLALQTSANLAKRLVSSDHRDLYRRPLTVAELARFDAVILDPPRAGAQEQVVALAASSVPCIAYVSCNPATFARDAKILIEGGYQLISIKPVGQFRWSTHVELAAEFSR